MKHIQPITIRCGNEKCGEIYTIPVSSSKEMAKLDIAFAVCPHCKHARNAELLLKYWGKPRCWSCKVPFDLKKKNGSGLCDACYLVLMRQKHLHFEKIKSKQVFHF